MIKFCRDVREIRSYIKYSNIKTGIENIPELDLNDDVFIRARQLFLKGYVLVRVWSKGKNGVKKSFYLKKQHDRVQNANGDNIEINVNFDGCDLLSEKNLDTSLLENIEVFLFEELEEYTYELARFIKNKMPDKRIFFLDSYARYFWRNEDDIGVLNHRCDIYKYWKGKYMLIKSGIRKYEYQIYEEEMLIYNSISVLNSLCWARNVELNKEKTSNGTVLLIDLEFGTGCGLAYIIRTICVFSCLAYERGWIPVIKLTGENMYIDKPTDEMWEQYFKPFSSISLQECIESKSIISLKNNHVNAAIIYVNPYFRKIWEETEKHPRIEFKKEVKDYFYNAIPQSFRDGKEKILGVLIRGTDAKEETEDEINGMILECKEIMDSKEADKIFIATEDARIFLAFKNAFKKRLLYIDQKRVSTSKENKKLIGDLLAIDAGKRKKFGQTYLLITFCLSKCDVLAFNIPSGGYYLANKWRKEPYKHLIRIGKKRTEIETLVECFETVRDNSLLVIYGAGILGKQIANLFSQKRNLRIIFCDQMAEKAEYLYSNYKVISPSSLLKEYRNGKLGKIIIASFNYSEEIYQALIANGIDPKCITIVNNQEGLI